MRTVVDDTHDKEEHRGDGAVIEHLEDRTGQPLRVHGRQTQGDNAHMTDAGIGDEFLEVRLRHCNQRAVHHADHPQQGKFPGEIAHRIGENREADSQQTVRPHLQKHAGKNHADRCGRFDVGVRQPGMERERRDFDGESDEQRNVGDVPPGRPPYRQAATRE